MQNLTADQNAKIDTAILFMEADFSKANEIYKVLADELGMSLNDTVSAVSVRYSQTR